MSEPSLFGDICVRKHRGNEASRAAHRKVSPHTAALRKRIYRYLLAIGSHGATVEEISRLLNLRYTTVSARVSELKKHGLVEGGFTIGTVLQKIENGVPVTRPTLTGAAAAVLVAMPAMAVMPA